MNILFWLELCPAIPWICLLAGLPLGYVYGRKMRFQGKYLDSAYAGWRSWLILGLFLLAMLLLMLAMRLPYAFPIVIGAYMEPLGWGLIQGTIAFLAASALPLSNQRRQAMLFIWVGLFAVALIQAAELWVNQPFPQDKLFERRAEDGSILQSSNVTCTAAALANALEGFDYDSSEKEVARILGTRRSGSTDDQVLKGIAAFGLKSRVVPVSAQQLGALDKPVMITVDLHGLRHSVVITGNDAKGNLRGIDPTAGRVVYTPQRLDKLLISQRGIQIYGLAAFKEQL